MNNEKPSTQIKLNKPPSGTSFGVRIGVFILRNSSLHSFHSMNWPKCWSFWNDRHGMNLARSFTTRYTTSHTVLYIHTTWSVQLTTTTKCWSRVGESCAHAYECHSDFAVCYRNHFWFTCQINHSLAHKSLRLSLIFV